MSDLRQMLMAEHRQVARDAEHPARLMAYDLALARRVARGERRWWRGRGRRLRVRKQGDVVALEPCGT